MRRQRIATNPSMAEARKRTASPSLTAWNKKIEFSVTSLRPSGSLAMPFKSPVPRNQSTAVHVVVAPVREPAPATGAPQEGSEPDSSPHSAPLGHAPSPAAIVGSAASTSRATNKGGLLAVPSRPERPMAVAAPALARWWRVSYRSEFGFGGSQKKKKE